MKEINSINISGQTNLARILETYFLSLARNEAKLTRILGLVERMYAKTTEKELEEIQRKSDQIIDTLNYDNYEALLLLALEDEDKKEQYASLIKKIDELDEDS